MRTQCPHCSTSFSVSEEHIGKKARCKSCSTDFVLSQTTTEARASERGREDATRISENGRSNVSPGDAATSVVANRCQACGNELLAIQEAEKITGSFCANCHPPNGVCPTCRGQLRTKLARQCHHCKASWRVTVDVQRPAIPSPVGQTSRPTQQVAASQKFSASENIKALANLAQLQATLMALTIAELLRELTQLTNSGGTIRGDAKELVAALMCGLGLFALTFYGASEELRKARNVKVWSILLTILATLDVAGRVILLITGNLEFPSGIWGIIEFGFFAVGGFLAVGMILMSVRASRDFSAVQTVAEISVGNVKRKKAIRTIAIIAVIYAVIILIVSLAIRFS